MYNIGDIKQEIKNLKKYSDYINISNQIDKSDEIRQKLKEIKIFFLRSYTLENIETILKVECFKDNMYPKIKIGGFNQYFQEVLNTESDLFKFKPNIVIISIRLEDLFPELYKSSIIAKDILKQKEHEILNMYETIINNIKKNLDAFVLIDNFVPPIYMNNGIYDFQITNGVINFIRLLNYKLVELKEKYKGVYINDLEHISSNLGNENIIDSKMWYLAKNPFNVNLYINLANVYVKYIKAIYGKKKKCIVLDLDNTLWGGIIGEDGFNGIKLGETYPGNCYKDFQIELLKLKQRGIILAINSKNNYDDAIEVINNHPDMILRERDFVSIKINWNDKASNIMDIARELNIGLDSMVFIDDNPVECEYVKEKLPEVVTIKLPENPIDLKNFIDGLDYFESLELTNEDRKKTDMYREQIQRENFKSNFDNIIDFYKNLNMIVTIKSIDDFYIPRVAQLTQKTNQFNLTTKRYTEEDIKKINQSGKYLIYVFNVEDKFGDYGTVGLVIIQKESDKIWYIDTFLMSCRVMNRMLENVMMGFIYEQAVKNSIETIIGEYIPTRKNIPVKDFYPKMGFVEKDRKYYLDIRKANLNYPEYYKINIAI
ncbi:HAD-IIIC family phosphatase [Thermoanaerobacteraceae bacterium SP2]|nr:HAD-IIIC family phosphatase [Thermoanaerobacteraceae bacterium SP2]